MIRPISICALTLFCLSQIPARAAETHDQLLVQVQAADVLSDLLTWHSNRITVRLGAMAGYLKEIGKLDAYEQNPPAASGQGANTPFYSQVFAGAVQFINAGGDQYADPALKKFNDSQLFQELTSLQEYDIQQFVYLNQKRKVAASVAVYLNSINHFPDYLKWTSARIPQGAELINGVAPSAMTPEQTVAWGQRIVQSARAAAWKRAQAQGVSQADFDRQWAVKQEQFKADVSQRVKGMAALATALQPSPPPSPPAQNAPAPQNNNWNTWNDAYPDGYTTYQGPGLYRSYDTRIDNDYDTRIDGEYDRRIDLNFDRRQNIQIDVQQGV